MEDYSGKDKTACIILNYNDAGTTASLVEKLRMYSCLDTIILVDNCSVDQSWEQLKALEDKKHIYVLRTRKNSGYGMGNQAGINFCVEQGLAEYIMVANPDIQITEACIRRVKEALNHTAEAAVASASVVSTKGQPLFSFWMLVSPLKELFDTGLITRRLFRRWINTELNQLEEGGDSGSRIVGAVPGSFFMLKCSMLSTEQLKRLFDPDIFLYQEEKILGQKMKQWGKKVVLAIDTFYIHAHSVSIDKSYSKIVDKQRILHNSKILYFKRYLHVGRTGMKFVKLFLNAVLAEIWILTNIFGMRW